MKIKSKIWLDNEGKLIFGTGKSDILKAVKRTGSLNRAAKELNMSYRHAWSYIQSIEKRIGKQLLVKNKGGKDGGGATLTQYASDLLEKFDSLEKEVKVFVNNRFKEVF
ncbi:MAG: LysR family transcriptional regulator [Candidatus Omnitrophica bacterium]|nr:LysR family transcriptional regulator [Candidatus Omnitrophota bacterium]